MTGINIFWKIGLVMIIYDLISVVLPTTVLAGTTGSLSGRAAGSD